MAQYKDIINLIDSVNNKTAFVAALGPSLRPYIEWINNNRNYLTLISCNDVDLMTPLSPDYWGFANSIQTMPFMAERFKSYPNSTIVYADSVDQTPRSQVEKILDKDFYGYDQRHFNGQTCSKCPNRCANVIPERYTIQEHLQQYTNHSERYSTGDTVAVHLTALAVLLGCKKIYIAGCDLDYSKGYVNQVSFNNDSFSPYIQNIINDFKIIAKSAQNIGAEIINLSSISPLQQVLPTQSYASNPS